MTAPVSVLHVTQPVDGGVGAYVAAVCADQVSRGWEVTLACPGGALADGVEPLGVRWMEWRSERGPSGGVAEARRIGRLAAAVAPGVVHLHSSKAGLAGRLALRGRLPTVFQPHGWSWLAARGPVAGACVAWERAATRWTRVHVCVGEGEVEHGRARGVRGSYALIRNGVDLGQFTPGDRGAARRDLGLPGGAPLAVCVGRVTRQKGQDLLVAAWPAVRARSPEALLVIVGEGEDLPRLRALAGPGIVFAGAAGEVRPWYAAADLVVMPSRWEGLPLVALEALASGRPLVAAAVAGLTEVVSAGVGALVPPEDVVALAGAVADRLAAPGLAEAEGAAAALAARRFDRRVTFDVLAGLTGRLAYWGPGGAPRSSRYAWDESGSASQDQTPCGQ
jgi:glycosyltransferase involved in cell wall biosynthesis